MKIRTDYTHEQVENLVRMARAAALNVGLGEESARILGRYIEPFIDRDAELILNMGKAYYGLKSDSDVSPMTIDRMREMIALVREHDKANPPAE